MLEMAAPPTLRPAPQLTPALASRNRFVAEGADFLVRFCLALLQEVRPALMAAGDISQVSAPAPPSHAAGV